MTTSLQLAQECLRDGLPEPSEPPQPLEGLEMFAQTIETGEQAPPGHRAPGRTAPALRLCLTETPPPLSAAEDQGDLPGHCREGGARAGRRGARCGRGSPRAEVGVGLAVCWREGGGA